MENEQCVLMYNQTKFTEDEVRQLASTLTETQLKEKGIYIIYPSVIPDNSEPTLLDVKNALRNQFNNFKVEFTEQSNMEKALTKIKLSL